MVIFNSYVKLPEGILDHVHRIFKLKMIINLLYLKIRFENDQLQNSSWKVY